MSQLERIALGKPENVIEALASLAVAVQNTLRGNTETAVNLGVKAVNNTKGALTSSAKYLAREISAIPQTAYNSLTIPNIIEYFRIAGLSVACYMAML